MLLTVINTRCNWFVSGNKPLLGSMLVVRVTNLDVKMKVEGLPVAILDLWRHFFRHFRFPVGVPDSDMIGNHVIRIPRWRLEVPSQIQSGGQTREFPNLHSHIQTGRTGPVFYIWLKGYIYSSCYYHHQIGSIDLSHCYHIFPWSCVWDVCYIIFCHVLRIHSGKTGILFSSLLCSLWWVQIVGYVMTCRSYSFVCTLHHLIIISVQIYL